MLPRASSPSPSRGLPRPVALAVFCTVAAALIGVWLALPTWPI